MRLNLKEKGVKRERGKTDEGTICSVTLYFLSRSRGKRAAERNTCYLITVSWMSCVLCAFLLAPSLMFKKKKKNLIHLVCRSHYSGVGLLDMGLDNCLLSIKCFCCLSTLFRLVFFTQLCYWKEATLQQKSCHWPIKIKIQIWCRAVKEPALRVRSLFLYLYLYIEQQTLENQGKHFFGLYL